MKKISFLKITLTLGICLSLSFQTMAWGLLGHRIVGEVADSYITKKTRKAITGILGNESIAMSSNWADFIKSDTNYKYLDTWHYVNIRSGVPQQEFMRQLETDTATNAYTKINYLVNQLKSGQGTQAEKIMNLRLLIHFVGDMHQPMHVGRPDDRGGNRVRVLWFNDPYNLHQVWDEVLITFQKLSYTEFARAINYTTKEQRKQWQSESISQWMYDTYQNTELIYADVKTKEDKLGYEYNFKYKDMLEQQLLKGGVRLAGILNDIFG